MRYFLLSFCVIGLLSCNGSINQDQQENLTYVDSGKKTIVNDSQPLKTFIYAANEKEIFNVIKSYYVDSAPSVEDSIKYEIEQDENLCQIVILQVNEILPLASVYIPINANKELFGANPIIKGDLSNDGVEDIVVSVQVEGGGTNYSQNLFTFIKENGRYRLSDVSVDNDISGCSSSSVGIFRAKKIENGFLVGKTDCWTEDDPRSSPSLHYTTMVNFANNKLQFVSKEKLTSGSN